MSHLKFVALQFDIIELFIDTIDAHQMGHETTIDFYTVMDYLLNNLKDIIVLTVVYLT